MAHATAGRRGDASDEADDRLAAANGVGVLEEISSILLGTAANLANHDDAVGVGVLGENLEAVDKVRAVEGVAANAHDERLAEACLGRLVDGLVCQRAGARHNADAALLVDEPGHDANLALAGSDDAGAVGTDQARLVLRLEHLRDADHVCAVSGVCREGADCLPCCGMPSVMQTMRGISASRASSIPAAATGGLLVRVSATLSFIAGLQHVRDEESGGRGAGFLDTVADVLEDGQVEVCSAGLFGVCAANNLGACDVRRNVMFKRSVEGCAP